MQEKCDRSHSVYRLQIAAMSSCLLSFNLQIQVPQISVTNKCIIATERVSHHLRAMASKGQSLQELSAAKAVEELLQESHPEAFFRNLETVQQELIFSRLLKDYKRMKVVEDEHRVLLKLMDHMPDADRDVHLGGWERLESKAEKVAQDSGEEADDIEDEGEDDDDTDAFDRAREFQAVWRYADQEDLPRLESQGQTFRLTQEGKRVYRHSFDLKKLSEDAKVQYLPSNEFLALDEERRKLGKEFVAPRDFWQLISSQLLLYRLAATFGPPPSDVMEQRLDGYKCCWDTLLVLKEEAQTPIVNHLTLGEHKGSAKFAFFGTKEGSEKALELVNYLVGKECAHSYDNVLAGRQAQ